MNLNEGRSSDIAEPRKAVLPELPESFSEFKLTFIAGTVTFRGALEKNCVISTPNVALITLAV